MSSMTFGETRADSALQPPTPSASRSRPSGNINDSDDDDDEACLRNGLNLSIHSGLINEHS